MAFNHGGPWQGKGPQVYADPTSISDQKCEPRKELIYQKSFSTRGPLPCREIWVHACVRGGRAGLGGIGYFCGIIVKPSVRIYTIELNRCITTVL